MLPGLWRGLHDHGEGDEPLSKLSQGLRTLIGVATYRRTADPCPLDGLRIGTHVACANCFILVGESHLERTLVGDICETCAGYGRPTDREYVDKYRR